MNDPPSVLIVDDELSNFDVLEALLHKQGYQLYYASDGARALTFLDATQPDVILLDVMMPGLDGLETCRRIRANRALGHIPIVMVTALTDKADLVRCLEAGATDFVSKPVNGLELCARVRSMLRIKRHYDELQTLLQMREDMVNMMVHDLRNPVSSILLAIYLLRQSAMTPEMQHKKYDQIEHAGQQLQAQIDSLLLMAKLESGKMALHCTAIDLNTLCTSILADFEAIATQKEITLIRHLPPPGGAIYADGTLVRRVLDNLLSNAAKFSRENSQIILRADYLSTGGATLQVADYGRGVDEAFKRQIFEKYETGVLIDGTSQIGLGLAFCKMAVEAHQGTIYVEDNHPQGTIFTISLPSGAPANSPHDDSHVAFRLQSTDHEP